MLIAKKHTQTGFTLIELMIVVVVVAILAAVAYPSYQNQVERGRLAEGKAALTQATTRMERCYTTKASYKSCINGTIVSESGFYNVKVSAVDDNTFTLVAERAKAAGANQCGNLTVTQTGQTGVTGGATKSASECWR